MSMPANIANHPKGSAAFCGPEIRAKQKDWEGMARFLVGAFRVDAARAGAVREVVDLVDELCRASPHFAKFWNENDVYAPSDGVKHLRHAKLGTFEMEYSAFAVDGRPDLGLLVYNPLDARIKDRIRALVARKASSESRKRRSARRRVS